MPLSKKMTANQRNAQRSTGPRTVMGKSRARLNALKHGLAIPAAALPEFAPDVAQVAQAITAEAADTPTVRETAVRVAEATIDVLRARRAKTALLEGLMRDPAFQQAPTAEPVSTTLAQPKHSRVAHARAISAGTEEQYLDAYFAAKAARVEQRQQARQHALDWGQLDKLDRYERRALSRRNKAIKAFDEAWAAAGYGSADHLTSFWQNEPMEDANTHQGQPTAP
jgi:hypothetical protein